MANFSEEYFGQPFFLMSIHFTAIYLKIHVRVSNIINRGSYKLQTFSEGNSEFVIFYLGHSSVNNITSSIGVIRVMLSSITPSR